MALLAESGDDLPQIPAASEFPNALAAMESVEPSLQKAESQAQWSVGDAVLEDIPIQRVGVRDGSLERLAALAKSRGYERYTADSLRRLRSVASRFPDVRRRTSYSWTIHEEAGDPDTLDEIIRMAEAEGVSVTFRYARAKKRQIEEQRTRAPSAGDLAGATTQAEQKVIPMALPRTNQPSLKEQVAVLTEELQQKDEEIAGLQRLAEHMVDFEVARTWKRAREQLSPARGMTRAIAAQNDDIVRAEVVDGSQQTAELNQTNAQVYGEELEQIVGPKTEPWGGLKLEVRDAMEKLADDFDEIVARHDLSDVNRRQMAVRYLSQQILNRKVFNDGREA